MKKIIKPGNVGRAACSSCEFAIQGILLVGSMLEERALIQNLWIG